MYEVESQVARRAGTAKVAGAVVLYVEPVGQ